jgi:hypothetical protein
MRALVAAGDVAPLAAGEALLAVAPVPSVRPKRRGRCDVYAWDGYPLTQFVRERPVHTETDRQSRRSVGPVELIYGVKPGAVGFDVTPLAGLLVHHIKWLGKIGTEPVRYEVESEIPT